MKTPKIDQRFVLTAGLILVFDAVIMVVCYFLFGKEVTGIDGAFVTAVCVGIYSKFPKLRFERVAESQKQVIAIQEFSWYSLFGSLCIFFGSQVACWIFLGGAFGVIWLFLTVPNIFSTDLSFSEVLKQTLTSTLMVKFIFGITSLSYLVGGFFVGKTTRSSPYKYAVVGSFLYAFLSTAVNLLVAGDLIAFAGLGRWPILQLVRQGIAQIGLHLFFFVWLSWVGARIAMSQSPPASTKKRRK